MGDYRPVVIDNGSGRIKAGFAGNDVPTAVFPNMVGHLNKKHARYRFSTSFPGDKFIGDDAQNLRAILSLRYPVDRGVIRNFEDMEAIWNHLFSKTLNVQTQDHPVLLTTTPLLPKRQHAQVCEVMFDTFNVPSVHLASTGVLSMAALGRSSGVVVDCGDSVTYVMPVINDKASPADTAILNYAGWDLTMRMAQLIANTNGIDLADSSTNREIAREIKQKLCFVSSNYAQELQNIRMQQGVNYELPDGTQVKLGEERFTCPEALFQPAIAKRSGPGIHEMVLQAIRTTSDGDEAIQRLLFSNIITVGGSTAFEGFNRRLAAEVQKGANRSIVLKVMAPKEYRYLAWMGGSKTALLPHCAWLTKKEYEERGAPAIFAKLPGLV